MTTNGLTTNILSHNKQTPIKIRNVIAAQHQQQQQMPPQQTITTTSNIIQINPSVQQSSLRTLVINKQDNTTSIIQSPSTTTLHAPTQNHVYNAVGQQNNTINSNTINNNTSIASASSLNSTSTTAAVSAASLTNSPSVAVTTATLPLSFAISLHKQNFPNVQFKCLNFVELAVSFTTALMNLKKLQ